MAHLDLQDFLEKEEHQDCLAYQVRQVNLDRLVCQENEEVLVKQEPLVKEVNQDNLVHLEKMGNEAQLGHLDLVVLLAQEEKGDHQAYQEQMDCQVKEVLLVSLALLGHQVLVVKVD